MMNIAMPGTTSIPPTMVAPMIWRPTELAPLCDAQGYTTENEGQGRRRECENGAKVFMCWICEAY
jgi:hypothetical protein